MRSFVTFAFALTFCGAVSSCVHAKKAAFDFSKPLAGRTWKVSNATIEFVEVDGKSTARLRAAGDSGLTGNAGLAVASTSEFTTGTIALDLKGRNQRPSFLGVVFNVVNEQTFEGIYFRPFNFRGSEPFRLRAVQYIAWPKHTWEELRKDYPGQFEKPVSPALDGSEWFHARIEVTDKLVRVFVDHAKEPCLTANRLAEVGVKRPIGVFVDVAEGLFANLEVTPAS